MPQKRPPSPTGSSRSSSSASSSSSSSTNYRGLPTSTTSVTFTEKSLYSSRVYNNNSNRNKNLSPTFNIYNTNVPSNVMRQQQHLQPTLTVTTTTSSSDNNRNNDRLSGATDSNCTTEFKKHYCLNDGICFNYTIQQNFTLLSCLCADGFYGERCEDKYLEGTYSTSKWNIHSISFYGFSLIFTFAVFYFLIFSKSHVFFFILIHIITSFIFYCAVPKIKEILFMYVRCCCLIFAPLRFQK